MKLQSLVRVQAASEVHANEAEDRCLGGMHIARDERMCICTQFQRIKVYSK